MSFLTTLQYKNYATKVINTGEDYQNASRKFTDNIQKTIPKHFEGRTAQKALEIASDISSSLNRAGINIENIGYGIRSVANNNDID